MQQQIFKQISAHFSLGEVIGEPEIMTLGRLHYAWRLHTRKNFFLVKKINFNYWRFAYAQQDYFVGEHIAKQIAQKTNGCRHAIFKNHLPYIKIDSHFYMVYPWLLGEPIATHKITSKQLQHLATLIVKIHQADFTFDLPKPHYFHCDKKQWSDMINAFAKVNKTASNMLANNIDEVNRLTQKSFVACEQLSHHLVISHRDCDWSNVIWRNDQPTIIDWELAGLINPWREAVGLLMGWSLVNGEQLKINNAKVFWDQYINMMQVTPTNQECEQAFYAVFNDWLGWMFYHLVQSRNTSVNEVINTWTCVQTVLRSKETILALIKDAVRCG